MSSYCIASPHTSPFWYEYQIYTNLISSLSKLGYTYTPESHNRLYFLGFPMRHSYPDVPFYNKSCNNLALMFSHPQYYTSKLGEMFSNVFPSSPNYLSYIKSIDSKVSATLLKPFSSLVPSDNEAIPDMKCDIAFVGNTRVRPLVEKIIPIVKKHKLNFKIWGYAWNTYQGNKEAIPYWQGSVIPYKDMPNLAKSAKILLCDHHGTMNQVGVVSHKYVDLLASKAFVIADDNKDIPLYKGVVFEGEQQILSYLADSKKREDKVEEQYDIVKNLTTDNAAKLISSFFK